MEKKFYQNVFLFNSLIAATKTAFRKIAALSVANPPALAGAAPNFNKQTSSEAAQLIARVSYKIFDPLTAAWLT